MKSPKFIIGIALGILGGWLVASSGSNLLSQYFPFLTDGMKLIGGLALAYFGLIKLK